MTHDISFFVSSNHLAIDTEYGAISETEFRTTTSFSVPANSELRAVSNGHVLLVKQDATIGNSPINIIIKVLDPTKSSPAAKYIIYRNIDAEMFFDGDGGLLRDSDSSEFITELNRPYNPDEVVPESRYFAANADDNTYLEQVFSGDTGLLCVKAGCVFGRIKQSENIGIDIVLYSDFDFDINVGMARRSENVISTLQTTVDHNIISSEKFTKESILRFIDPVVFFNINCKETISYNNDGNASIAKLYLDIRNNLGYSYDYPNSQPTEKLVTVNGSDAQTLSKSRFWPEYTLDVNTIIAEHGECQLQIKKPKYAGGNSLSMILSCQPDNRQLDFGGLQYSEIDDKYIVYIDKSDEEYTPIIKISQLTASTLLRIDILIPPSTDSVAGVPLYQPQHDLDFLMRVPVIPNQESNSQKNHWIINKNHSYFQNLKSLGFGVSGLVEELESNKINYVYFFCPDQYFATDNSCSINEYFPRVSSYNDSKAFDFVSSMYKVNRLTDDMYIPEYRTNNNVNKLVYFICLSEENQIIVQSKLQSFNCTFHDVCLSLRHSTQGTIQDATIVERQLYLVGMSSSGTYTEVDTGIKIYSTDNLIFVSKDYQTVCKQEYDLQTQIPFELHFTLPGDYSSRAHYLFDWMRPEYLENSGIVTGAYIYGNECKSHEEALRELKKEYDSFEINNHTYYVPKLICYANHSEYMRSIGVKTNKCDVILNLTAHNISKDNPCSEGDYIEFELPNGANITIEGVDVNKVGSKARVDAKKMDKKTSGKKGVRVIITCQKPVVDSCITIKYYRNNTEIGTIGKLNVTALESNVINNLTVNIVKVDINGSYTKGHSKIDFSTKSVSYLSGNYTLEGWADSWLKKINQSINNINKFILQTGTKVSFKKSNLSVKIGDIEFGNNKYINDFEGFMDLLASDARNDGWNFKVKFRFGKDHDPTSFITDAVISAYEKRFPNNKEVTLFALPVYSVFEAPGVLKEVDAFQYNGSKYIFLSGNIYDKDVYKRIPNIIAHELFHIFGLPHTFRDVGESYNSQFRYFFFEQYATDNIMDYHDKTKEYSVAEKNTLYKWQHDIINGSTEKFK